MSAIAWRTRLLVVGVACVAGTLGLLGARGTGRTIAQEKKADAKPEKKDEQLTPEGTMLAYLAKGVYF